MHAFFQTLPACLIGMEACASAHYWAWVLTEMGHTVKLIAPQFVKPYVKGNKNDANDAEAICEAVSRPGMRFVPVKTIEQLHIQARHRVRSELIKQRTAKANQIRGLLAEYGIVIGWACAACAATCRRSSKTQKPDCRRISGSCSWAARRSGVSG